MVNAISKVDGAEDFSFMNVKKSLFGYNVDQVNTKARLLYNDYSDLQAFCDEISTRYANAAEALEVKGKELHDVKASNEALSDKVSDLQHKVEVLTMQLKEATNALNAQNMQSKAQKSQDGQSKQTPPKFKRSDDSKIKTQADTGDKDEDVFVGEIEDKPVGDRLLIGDESDNGTDDGFEFL
mgnify:CR=1 FL=1